jgi:hypothetical protein
MSNLAIDPDVWLEELFEYEYCGECHGDAPHHDAIGFLDNWFARCKESHPTNCQIPDCTEDME